MSHKRRKPDEKVKLALDPEEALRALLAVDPNDEPTSEEAQGEARREREPDDEK